ncbi:MAG: hypothetical protein GF418_05275 [Chitinivibrionales bacterium]|nr:hypothetical protein [Chitinivibrionales bacterium]MBD3395022.1 hypothetical protein [Chitinivibrionales bacterium]
MKTTVLTFTVMFALCAAAAQGPTGFHAIPFGSHREVVIGALVHEFDMAPKGHVVEPPYWSPLWMDLYVTDDALLLTNYEENGKSYDVTFFFNVNGRFCGFTMKGNEACRRRDHKHHREEIIRLAEALQRNCGAGSIPMLLGDNAILRNAGAGADVGGDTRHAVVAAMVPRDRSSKRFRLLPVGGVWNKALKTEPHYAKPFELTRSELRERIAACVEASGGDELARSSGYTSRSSW